MESMRDIIVTAFSVTGTVASVVLLIICLKLYGRPSQALERVGRASDDIHDAAEGAHSGVRLAIGATGRGPCPPGSQLVQSDLANRGCYTSGGEVHLSIQETVGITPWLN